MLYQIIQYIKFFLKSTNQHGVHSPFVYNLVTKCFYDNTSYTEYKNIIAYRRSLLKNKSTIAVTDLGVGSSKIKSTARAVSKMAKHAGTPLQRAKLLFRLVHYFNSKHILELGTSLGIASQAMRLGNPKATIISIEGCPNLAAFTKANFLNNIMKPINFMTGDFKDALSNLTNNSFDFIFFDGNHTKTATLNYFNTLLPTIHNDSVFIFDDIYWSKEMTEAWEVIKEHPQVTVTIDTFYWGFVFFRKEQHKEHFKIRV
ncbi:O-methyltransferase [Yeosuana marina]|uniref:O-methyltransferase n=1 Tax=Yeosuana marina TaxID=1565536 RepID=UPI0014241C81|nr:class I SAM-dependent methyltransferase [Yeosuana marina]